MAWIIGLSYISWWDRFSLFDHYGYVKNDKVFNGKNSSLMQFIYQCTTLRRP
jgi:hypothetical protein